MYNPKSLKAEEFIDHNEVEDTLNYAEQNKNNVKLIDEIIEKAKRRKGLSHREASVLMACDLPEKIAECYDLAEQIKKDFYGNRIVMFAPLYLSNYCVNGCVYCPYHMKNKHIARKKLTQEEIVREVTALQDMGHKRLAIEAGEHPEINPIEYILESINTIYSIKHKRRNPAGKREYRSHHRGKLQKAKRRGNWNVYFVSGNLPQGKLLEASPHRPQARLCLPHRGNGQGHGRRH